MSASEPVRECLLPYARQWIDEEDIEAVARVLRSDWITTGPAVEEFEEALAAFVGARHAVAVSTGTAALHAATYAAGVGPGDEVIVSCMSFVATANAVVFQGGTPVFADVDAGTLLIDPESVEDRISNRTKAVLAVDYAGQPCDYDTLRSICDRNDLTLIADACHSLGAERDGRPVGTLADISLFSFHPVKHITAGEGGMCVTDDAGHAERMRLFRNHGITVDHHERRAGRTWRYDVVDLGYNYRLTDFQCALATSQLRKLPGWLARRREIALRYGEAFCELEAVEPLRPDPSVEHAYHLYVIELDLERLDVGRGDIFAGLRDEGIGVNVHYVPIHLHSFYRRRFGTGPGLCPVAEAAYERILSLPIFPRMTDDDVEDVITAALKVIGDHLR
ncbi:MAG: UDP-4-amino-4,6-dideoxy-N-acetyl-beta-L-altrosamine transaminase [Gemmatimonadetes bacterium]|nr:UDP-4-amino-4,6-dideoxy-N-acetyl-beta-L-altrosamine transaminase [Gemmatimonadota bacterium]